MSSMHQALALIFPFERHSFQTSLYGKVLVIVKLKETRAIMFAQTVERQTTRDVGFKNEDEDRNGLVFPSNKYI